MKKKIALVVQRYGLEVNGGAEYHCRLLAEKLMSYYNVEILTSCAKDYITWANEYQPGVCYVNQVKINRFEVEHPRDKRKFRKTGKRLRKNNLRQLLLKLSVLPNHYKNQLNEQINLKKEQEWLEEQGPYVPGLIKFIENSVEEYEAFIFFTCLYYPTVEGLQIAPQKSILIPTAHDEPPLYLKIYQKVFQIPRAILYNTESEKIFVNKLFNNSDIYSNIAGIGIDAHEPTIKLSTKNILNTDSKYIVYMGRIEASKGCGQLMNYFIQYKTTAKNDLKLVFIGQAFMKLIENADIIYLGFVTEDIKLNLLKNAEALIIPSLFESLSLVTLESMAHGIPVIANERCQVIKDHIDHSKAGFLYNDTVSFKTAVDTILNPATDKVALSINAKSYIAKNYTWLRVIEKFTAAIDYVSGN